MQPSVQLLEIALEVRLVGLPRQPVRSGRGILLQFVEGRSEAINVDMVEKRGEPFLPSLSCGLPYALQRLGHGSPALHPAPALLGRVSLCRRPLLPPVPP